jgi:hypothetical protein
MRQEKIFRDLKQKSLCTKINIFNLSTKALFISKIKFRYIF